VTAPSVPRVVASATVPPEPVRLLSAASFRRTVIAEVELPFAAIEPGLAEIVELDSDAVPAFTVSVAVSVLPEFEAVTVCAPAVVAVQVAPVHDPFGTIEKVDDAVRSPSELFVESKPATV